MKIGYGLLNEDAGRLLRGLKPNAGSPPFANKTRRHIQLTPPSPIYFSKAIFRNILRRASCAQNA